MIEVVSFSPAHGPNSRTERDALLNDLESKIPALITANDEPGFWIAFDQLTLPIKDYAGSLHGEHAGHMIGLMLSGAGMHRLRQGPTL